jgi:ABC-2 type transport system permease protein/lipopolysaccharide transport system permease protein
MSTTPSDLNASAPGQGAGDTASLQSKGARPVGRARRQKADLPEFHTERSAIRAWFADLSDALAAWPVWTRIAMMDISSRHRRFLLGMLWVPLGMAIFVFALGYVYSYLRGHAYAEFTPYLAASMIFWTIIHSSVTQGMSVFTSMGKHMANVRLPFHYYVLKVAFENMYTALLTSPVYIFCLLFFDVSVTTSVFLLFPALVIFIISSFSTLVFIGLLSLRFRDIKEPMSNFMRLMFLVTPVIWMVSQRAGSKRAAFVDYNPFYHYLEIARAPLLGYAPSMMNWIVSGSACLVLTLAASILMMRWRSKIHYWV